MLKSLDRVVKAGQRIQRELDKIPDDKLDAEISRIKDMFEKLAKTYDRGEEQLVKLSTEGDDADLYGLMDLQNARAGRLSDVAERLERVEAFDRAEARAEIMRSVDDVVGRVAVLNQRRAVRVEKLKARAKALNPKLVDERVKGLQARMVERLNNVADRWRTQGDFDLESGKADFSGRARELAEEITNKIIGNTSLRLPGIDILQGERGPELARLLDIDNDLIEPWLERDIERLSRIYTHTLAPDVEIAGKFGSVRAEEAFKRLEDEFNAKRAALPEGDEKAATRLQRDYEETVRDLEAVIGRLRHNWALPDNPRGLGHRLARTAIAFNYLRYMGGVTISSVPDMARPIMRYGLTHTFRHGFAPLVKNLKAVKLNAKQVKLAGTALDMILDTRQQALGDLFMDWQRGTKAERVLEYASNRFGLVSLMAPWNAAMKQFTGVLAIQDLLNAAEATRLGKATKRQTEILAANGIDAELAGRIMNQLEAGGGEKVDGQWLPNTEDWTDGAAVEAFRTAIVREVDNAIITPGVERPLWQSKLLGSADLGKLIGQFRSFSTSSVSKMMIAGLQQRDMAMVNGLVTSMALGALSYYLYGLATGGRAYEEMMNAGPEKWAAEAIERSGVLTVLSDANRIAEATPLRGISRFTGEQLTRQQPTDIFGAALGPSADLASRLVRGVSGFATGDPTKSDLHNLRVALIAGQNLFYLRRALDKIEEYVNLPERRESSASRKRGVLE